MKIINPASMNKSTNKQTEVVRGADQMPRLPLPNPDHTLNKTRNLNSDPDPLFERSWSLMAR